MINLMMEEMFVSPQLDFAVILSRTLSALVFGGLIGLEREYDGRAAGLRTHMLISLAACLYTLITLTLIDRASLLGDHVTADPLRVVEAVTQGVAFLAAGLVVFSRGRVRGLTTGTSMWLCAAVGLCCGIGEWVLAAMTTGFALAIIILIRFGEKAAGTYQPGHAEHSGKDDED